MENITLRLATTKDIPVFLELEKSVADSKVYISTKTEDEALEEFKKYTIYLIENGGEVVGSIQYEMKNSDHAYISGLVVDPKFQGQGIAHEAMKQFLENLKDVKRIDLVTHPDNTPAINLYTSLGFRIESKSENHFGDGEPRLILSRTS